MLKAIGKGNLEKVCELVGDGVELKSTHLRMASTLGYCEIVRVLIDNGVDIDGMCGSALRYASLRNQFEVVKLLLEAGADVHAKNDEALYNAAFRGRMDMVKILLDYGANVPEHVFTNITNIKILTLLRDYGIERVYFGCSIPEVWDYIPVNPRRVWVGGDGGGGMG